MNIWLVRFFLMVIHGQNVWTLHSGCFQNGSYYHEGEKVATEDPCLLCACRRGSLNCNLRVCAQLPGLLPPGCFVLHKPDDCCPQYFCEKNYRERGIEFRTAFEGDPSSNISDCMVDQTLYAEGSAVTSPHPCEYCYCVGGQVKCLKPRCMAPLDDCTPIYDKSSCCPTQFNCSSHKGIQEEYDSNTVHNKSETTFRYPNEAATTWTKGTNGIDFDLVDEQGLGKMKSPESWIVPSTAQKISINSRFQAPMQMHETAGGITRKNETSQKPTPFHVDEFGKRISYTPPGRALVISRKSKTQQGKSTHSPITVPEIPNLNIERFAMTHESPLKVNDSNKKTSYSKRTFMSKRNSFISAKKTDRSQREIGSLGGWTFPRVPVSVFYKHSVVNLYPNHLMTLPRGDFQANWMKTLRAENETRKGFLTEKDIKTEIIVTEATSATSHEESSTENYGSTIEPLSDSSAKRIEGSSILKTLFEQFLNASKSKPGPTASGSSKALLATNTSDRTAETEIGVAAHERLTENQFVEKTESSGLAQNLPVEPSLSQTSQQIFLLKLAACNIYGKVYDVGKIVRELSGDCHRCTCTYVGVECEPLTC